MTPKAESPPEEITLVARSDSLAPARARALDRCPPSLSPRDRAEAELVVGELLANAVEHGTGTSIHLAVRAIGDAMVEFRVRNEATNGLPPQPWVMPSPEASRGRGLAVVARLARLVEVSHTGDDVEVRVVLPA